MATYYAKDNPYGNEFSVGFANTWVAREFATKEERDKFVSNSTKLGTCAITAREARKINSQKF